MSNVLFACMCLCDRAICRCIQVYAIWQDEGCSVLKGLNLWEGRVRRAVNQCCLCLVQPLTAAVKTVFPAFNMNPPHASLLCRRSALPFCSVHLMLQECRMLTAPLTVLPSQFYLTTFSNLGGLHHITKQEAEC